VAHLWAIWRQIDTAPGGGQCFASSPAGRRTDAELGSEFAFGAVVAMAAAAQCSDVVEFRRVGVTLKCEEPSPAPTYAWLLLALSIVTHDGAIPDAKRIAELASDASPLLGRLSRFTTEDAVRVLSLTFADTASQSKYPLNDFLITLMLLGALVADPRGQLPNLRPHVTEICARLAAEAPEIWGHTVRTLDFRRNHEFGH
jgi:hypothetical protein